MSQIPDNALVAAVVDGDIHAFEILVKRYQRGLLVFVRRIVRDEAIAQEVVQDTLFSLYRTIERVDPAKKLSTYLFQIAKNTSISALRKKKKDVSLEDIGDIEKDEYYYETLVQKERSAGVHKALRKLPTKYRQAIRLYYFDQLSYGEVSKKLQIPINTVRTHLKRGKDQLAKLLHYEKNS